MKKALMFFIAAVFMSLAFTAFPIAKNQPPQSDDKTQIAAKLNGLLNERKENLNGALNDSGQTARNLKSGKSVYARESENALTFDEAVLLATDEMNQGAGEENFYTAKKNFSCHRFFRPAIYIYKLLAVRFLRYVAVKL